MRYATVGTITGLIFGLLSMVLFGGFFAGVLPGQDTVLWLRIPITALLALLFAPLYLCGGLLFWLSKLIPIPSNVFILPVLGHVLCYTFLGYWLGKRYDLPINKKDAGKS